MLRGNPSSCWKVRTRALQLWVSLPKQAFAHLQPQPLDLAKILQ